MKHMNWKKHTALALAAALSLSLLAACGGGTTETQSPVPEQSGAPVESAPAEKEYSEMTIEELKPLLQTATAGKLTVATSPDFAPMSSTPSAATGPPLWPASTSPLPATSPTTWAWSWRWSPSTLTAC